MNKRLIQSLAFLGLLTCASAQEGSGVSEADLLAIGILPSSVPVLNGTASDPAMRLIGPSERNPFSERIKDTPQVEVQTESEELKIKKLILDMQVHGGLMHRNGGPKVLLGDLILERGALIPQLIPDQTEQLVVRELDEEKIELAFLDTPEYRGQPRVILIPIDLRPTIGQVLAGGNDKYIVHRGPDTLAAEKQLAAVLATRASGGSIGTTIPGITVNGKTASRTSSSALTGLLRNYGQPGATAETRRPVPGSAGSTTLRNVQRVEETSSSGDTPAATPFDFGGFKMSPADASKGVADPSGTSAVPPSRPESSGPADDQPSLSN